MNDQPCQVSTIQTELDRVFKNLSLIEEKLWSPEPSKVNDKDCFDDKILTLKEDISLIANRLEIIDEKLSVIGK